MQMAILRWPKKCVFLFNLITVFSHILAGWHSNLRQFLNLISPLGMSTQLETQRLPIIANLGLTEVHDYLWKIGLLGISPVFHHKMVDLAGWPDLCFSIHTPNAPPDPLDKPLSLIYSKYLYVITK